jgi:hypothetical protein
VVLNPLKLIKEDLPTNNLITKTAADIIDCCQKLGYQKNGVIYAYHQKKYKLLIQLLNNIIQFNLIAGDLFISGLGGGTSYVPAIKLAESLQPRSNCILYFTDNKDDGSLRPSLIPLIFVSTQTQNIIYPWAHYISMDLLVKEDSFY